MGLHIGSTLDHVLGGGVASLVQDSPHKALSSPEELKALASALKLVLSEGIKHTTGLFSRSPLWSSASDCTRNNASVRHISMFIKTKIILNFIFA